MSIYSEIFSEFDAVSVGFKFPGETAATLIDTVGKIEETLSVVSVTKKKRGKTWKHVTRNTGEGELKFTAHIPYALYIKMHAMDVDGLKDGVTAYDDKSIRPNCIVTAKIEDEDGNVKYVAYPNCSASSEKAGTIEGGLEEVSEVEVTISVSPDEDGVGKYEHIPEATEDESITETWMTNFTSSLVKATA